ncbi:hypothetical protein NMG60_11037294 [Bertholletia excelsa]
MSYCHIFTACLVFITLVLFPLLATAHTKSCSKGFEYEASTRNITKCKKLKSLGAEFGWTFHNGSSLEVEIFVGARLHSEKGWLAWGVNPQDTPQMAGTRAIIGITHPDGSATVDTYSVTRGTKLGCGLQPSELDDVAVLMKKFDYLKDIQYFAIHAKVVLNTTSYNALRLNHVWQVGNAADGREPHAHSKKLQNMISVETIDLETGRSLGNDGHRERARSAHGILNIAGWGTVLPIGAIIMRYSRAILESPWPYGLHVACQSIGYVLGTAGWAVGLWLAHSAKYYSFPTHGMIGCFIFAFATLQMMALRLRPRHKDEYRKYWNMYHHTLGYSLFALSSYNIFRGIRLLAPAHSWKWAYLGILGALAAVVLALEVFTWYHFVKTKRDKKLKEGSP